MPQLQLRIIDVSAPAMRLCDSCAMSVVMRGAGQAEELVYCNEMHQAVAMRVVECNRYQEDREPHRLEWMLQAVEHMQEDDEDLLADYPFDV